MIPSPYKDSVIVNSVPLENLLRHVTPVAPQLPHGMALDLVRQSYIEFARRTGLITARLVQDYQAGVHDYEIVPPKGYEVYAVLGFSSPSFSFVDHWRGVTHGFWNTKIDVVNNNMVYFHDAPTVDRAGGLVIYATVLPNSCADTIPVSIEVPFGRAIADGALARVLRIPNKTWTAPGIAREHELKYNHAIFNAKALATNNRKTGPSHIRPIRVV